MKLNGNIQAMFAALLLMCAGISSCQNKANKQAGNADTLGVNAVLPVQPVIVEIIAPEGKEVDTHSLYELAKGWAIPHENVVRWKNHTAIYAELSNPEILINSLKHEYDGDSIKVYDKAFYNFNRKQCADTVMAKERTHIILTANLVNDEKLQQEYLDHHNTQLENWPEVSQGFCNARFQQLLVFKTGRQLMLVISIPKGESLDSLNPLTTKNNPRVNEWNKLMAKYQEGLPGTKPGEVWVFLKPKVN